MQNGLLKCTRLRRLVLRHCWAASPPLFAELRIACPLLTDLTVDECDFARSEPSQQRLMHGCASIAMLTLSMRVPIV